MVPLIGEGCCGVGGASRDSTGLGAMEEGLISRGSLSKLPLVQIALYSTFSKYLLYTFSVLGIVLIKMLKTRQSLTLVTFSFRKIIDHL